MLRPHHTSNRRRYTAALAITTAGTLLAAGFQTGVTSAAPRDPGDAKIVATPRAGAAPAELSPAKHAALMKSAALAAGDTAKSLDLGSREKLIVKDVAKDADGTTHTRYERTYSRPAGPRWRLGRARQGRPQHSVRGHRGSHQGVDDHPRHHLKGRRR